MPLTRSEPETGEASIFKSFVNHYDVARPIVWSDQFNSQKPLDIEIGSGNGEFLVRQAGESPERNFIGLEQSWERVEKTLKRIAQANLNNVRVLLVDVSVAFERLFLPESIARMYCLFPCPWPKKAHIKHRLFSPDFLQLANSRLAAQGQLKIVTDYQPYHDWVREQVDPNSFEMRTSTVEAKYDTKYERKWHEQGQREFFETDLIKKRHSDIPVKKDIILQTYSLKSFDPDKFSFEDTHGSLAVVLKDFLFDEKRKTALIRFIVAEQGLTQHLWVKVVWDKSEWFILPAQANRFIPSTGIAQAMEMIFDACRRAV